MTNYSICAGKYQAQIRSIGGGINTLTYEGRDLVEPFIEGEPHRYRGDLLVPWPNRIRDGKYSYQNRNYVLKQNESLRANALHGLVLGCEWNLQGHDETSIELSRKVLDEGAYPSSLEINVFYQISEFGLRIEMKVTNIGEMCAPYGHSIHPYLVADTNSKVDSWKLKMPAKEYMEVDSERLLPIGIQDVREDFDFNLSRQIGSTFIDHAFLIDKKNEFQVVEITTTPGLGVGMRYSGDMKWIQIHTADRENGIDARTCLAVEPMTCPPDAFNSGLDLIHLNPNDSYSSTWEIYAI